MLDTVSNTLHGICLMLMTPLGCRAYYLSLLPRDIFISKKKKNSNV